MHKGGYIHMKKFRDYAIDLFLFLLFTLIFFGIINLFFWILSILPFGLGNWIVFGAIGTTVVLGTYIVYLGIKEKLNNKGR